MTIHKTWGRLLCALVALTLLMTAAPALAQQVAPAEASFQFDRQSVAVGETIAVTWAVKGGL